ncbi:DUF2790 domain-containing protein [Pseudomonas lurida]|uniref:DUF2790 domain-containing protein n=1 Tax=Pseudomonas TaxID=286 RepID=UPI0015E2793A|nr:MULTISPECIES: DUF2790 domain-containing protein [Pseudomonas]MBA1296313.1 DUF2790 domain-containing protein [Pseudomonas lurida]WLH42827.1 DUF2790 domain-containing protein [Pseudomonas sp. FP2254]
MNHSKALYAACLFAALNLCTLSARAQASANEQTYTYGTHLDIRKVLSITEDAGPSCGVVGARMTYLDSHGTAQVLNYQKVSDTCIGDN